jgi:hypothetical protein
MTLLCTIDEKMCMVMAFIFAQTSAASPDSKIVDVQMDDPHPLLCSYSHSVDTLQILRGVLRNQQIWDDTD